MGCVAHAPDWREGHERGLTGAALPKPRAKGDKAAPPSKAYLWGYHYGRQTYAWRLWMGKHGRRWVRDGDPIEDDPCPMTDDEVEHWLQRNDRSERA